MKKDIKKIKYFELIKKIDKLINFAYKKAKRENKIISNGMNYKYRNYNLFIKTGINEIGYLKYKNEHICDFLFGNDKKIKFIPNKYFELIK